MTITIFGSTGMVGRQVVELGLAMGYTLRAFGRNVFETFSTERKNLELFKGAVFDPDEVAAALENTDAVISVLGGAFDGTDKTRSLGMKTIVEAMEKKGIKRIVALGGLGVLQADEHTLIMDSKAFPPMYKAVSEEHFKAYNYLVDSALDWTIFCPPMILDAAVSGDYATNRNYPAKGAFNISAGDLADAMLGEVEGVEFLKCRVGISN